MPKVNSLTSGGVEGVNQRGHRTRRPNLVFDRKLRPARAGEHEVELAFIGLVVVDAAPVELRLRTDVPVDAQDRVAARLIHRRLNQRIVGARGIDGIRQRQNIEQSLTVLVDAIRRDDVARERAARVSGSVIGISAPF